MYIGGVSDLFNSFNSVANTSISPVGMFRFLEDLSATLPFIAITYSDPNFSALAKASSLTSVSKIIWHMPLLSL